MSAPVLMVGLDGFDMEIADALLAQGRLPALARLRERGATVLLDHGSAKRTGLAWEHVSSGQSPDHAERWAAVDFDPATYKAVQRPTNLTPFLAGLDIDAVVFDAPYCDLARAERTRGLVSWGAHDPGVSAFARPAGLAQEIADRFGPYPADQYIYGLVWPSRERTAKMGAALAQAVEVRSRITQWLFGERLHDWQLGLVVVSEYHSAVEALWHGIDPDHPLHGQPSAAAARAGLEGVYEAGDRMLGQLMEQFPEARLVAFNLHGMAANNADLPSMLLLPELLYRQHFGRALFTNPEWRKTNAGVPLIDGDGTWEGEIARGFRAEDRRPSQLLRRGMAKFRRMTGAAAPVESGMGWMPATRYQRFWREMPAFALPSFYDGRVRINLAGRERHGCVAAEDYDGVCDGIERLLRDCRDPITGLPVLGEVVRPTRDKFSLSASEADMIILWHAAPLGFVNPQLGQIGPAPYRRTGGHTGGKGVAYFSDRSGLEGVREMSAFDVVPTVAALLDAKSAARMSGTSALRAPALVD